MRLALLTLIAAVLLCADANAGTVRLEDGVLTLEGDFAPASGQATAQVSGNSVRILITSQSAVPGPGCGPDYSLPTERIRCPGTATTVNATLSDGPDALAINYSADRITLDGRGGDDHLLARNRKGQADLTGGEGDDVFENATGPNTFDGGAGMDVVDYRATNRAPGLFTLDNDLADDGQEQDEAGGRRDRLLGIEGVVGTPGNDTMTGGAEANLLIGLGGSDRIVPGPGADRVFGDVPSIAVEPFADFDGITAKGRDRIDTVDSTRDEIDCGGKRDQMHLDAVDKQSGCERLYVTRSCVVPKLRGLYPAKAKQKLHAAGCDLGKVREIASATGKVGVKSQSLKPGTKRPPGTKVDVVMRRRG